MKQWHILLDYIDSYVYNSTSEEIMIKPSRNAPKALEVYQRILAEYSIEESALLKWHFDIALDCVRILSEEDKSYYSQNYGGYSFTYGMFIRKNYIYPAKNHWAHISPDDQSANILDLIYTILHIDYNFFVSAAFLKYSGISRYGKDKVLDMLIEDLGLCDETCTCMRRANLNTVEDLISLTESEFMGIVYFKKECLDEVTDKLDSIGLALASDETHELTTVVNEQQTVCKELGLEKLDLTVQTYNSLRRSGINTVADLLSKTKFELMFLRFFDSKALDEVTEKLNKIGLSLEVDMNIPDSFLDIEKDNKSDENYVLQDALCFNYNNDKECIEKEHVGVSIYAEWTALMSELYKIALNNYTKKKEAIYQEKEEEMPIFIILKQINLFIGEVNHFPLSFGPTTGNLIVSFCSPKENSNKYSREYLFRLRVERFLGRCIQVQRLKTQKILNDEHNERTFRQQVAAYLRKQRRKSTQAINNSEVHANSPKESSTQMQKVCRSEILYIHKKQIKCQKENHDIISATAILTGLDNKEITLNVNYCKKCNIFFMNYTTYEMYKERYGVLLGNLRMESTLKAYNSHILSDESPLKLCGYSVAQKDGHSAQTREYIISQIIDKEIMSKSDVIKYLEYFIGMNGKKKGNEIALSKWKSDLKFTSGYNSAKQQKHIIDHIERYR